MKYLAIFSLLLASLLFACTAYSAEVLIVTWQGRGLPSEPAFEKKLKQLRPDVKYRYIDARRDKNELAAQLRHYDFSNTDLVYTFGTTCTKIVKQFVKGKKPIVFNIVSTPVQSGIAQSLERPGGNLTGARLLIDFEFQIEVLTKVKDIRKLAVWFDPREKQNTSTLKSVKKVANARGIEIIPVRVIPDSANFEKRHKENIRNAKEVDAVYVVATSSFVVHAKTLFSKVDPQTLMVGTIGLFARLGTSIAIGPEMAERGEAAAELANKVLSGAKAGEIPVRTVRKEETVLFINKNRLAAIDKSRIEKTGTKIVYVDTSYPK